MTDILKIDTQPVIYFSEKDEKYFFEWAMEIDAILSINMGYLHIDPVKLTSNDIHEISALLERYSLISSKWEDLIINKALNGFRGVIQTTLPEDRLELLSRAS